MYGTSDYRNPDSNDSFLTRYGEMGQQYSDPLYHMFGGDGSTYDKLVNEKFPHYINKGLSGFFAPMAKFDKELNPLRKNDKFDEFFNGVENKPGDALAIAAGAIFGGGALFGGGGAGGSAGGSGGGGGGLFGNFSNLFGGGEGSSGGAGGNFNWQKMLGKGLGGMSDGMQQQQQPYQKKSQDPDLMNVYPYNI